MDDEYEEEDDQELSMRAEALDDVLSTLLVFKGPKEPSNPDPMVGMYFMFKTIGKMADAKQVMAGQIIRALPDNHYLCEVVGVLGSHAKLRWFDVFWIRDMKPVRLFDDYDIMRDFVKQQVLRLMKK